MFTKLSNCKHNGFPVLNHKNEVVGLISRNFLCIIIKQKFFEDEGIRKSRIDDLTQDRHRINADQDDGSSELMNPIAVN